MRELEQEVASVIRFVCDAVGEQTAPYYWAMPADFVMPAVYFPSPEITTDGDSLNTYEMDYSWFIKFFCKEDEDANDLALHALVAIQQARCCIPLIDTNGLPTGRNFRLDDPQIRKVDRGAWQMEVRWRSSRYYNIAEVHKAVALYLSGIGGTLFGDKNDD